MRISSFILLISYFPRKIVFVFGIILMAKLFSFGAIPEEVRPLSSIRTEHPRLFLYSGDLSKIRERARGEATNDYEKLRKAVDGLPMEAPLIFLENRFTELPDGSIRPDIASRSGSQMVRYNGGDQAAQAAFLYLLDGRKEDLEKAKNYLRLANEVILWSAEKAKVWIGWRNHVELNALAAYDWIYNDLTPEERREFLLPLLDYIEKTQPGGEYNYRRTVGSPANGNYGVRALQWFAGVAAAGDGIDDERAARFLQEGATLFFQMLDHREKVSAGSGLLASPTVGYSFGPYPDATFLFFYSWRSAFLEDLSGGWTQMADYSNWFDWSAIWVDPERPRFLHYGIGDLEHKNNLSSTSSLYPHFAQAIHFYGDRFPEKAEHAYAQIARLPESVRVFNPDYPFIPFLVTNFDPQKIDSIDRNKIDSERYFFAPSFGLFFMRAGLDRDDTHVAFRGGSSQGNHQHYDELSFVIFKRNFLALDGGSRTSTAHHHNFAAQSVAHNTLLIHEPEEPMPNFWKPWGFKPDGKTYYNHGGQNSTTAARTIAVQSGDDFVYIAADATKSYSSAKSKEVVRQFVYLRPNSFVIYDRVESVKPEQKKEFLLHFQNEPIALENSVWQADFDGRLFVETVLPKEAEIALIGGPGKEFFASGRNWPVVEPERADWDREFQFTGKWRLEVSDPKSIEASRFLHFLEATLPDESSPLPIEQFSEETTDGIRFTDRDGTEWRLAFNRVGPIGLHLTQINSDGKTVFSGDLPNEIED